MSARSISSQEHDKFVIDGLKTNDETASACLISRYLDPLIFYLRKNYSVPKQDAEEIASLALERVITKINQYDPSRSKFSTWIFQIAINLALDYHRSQKRQKQDTGEILSLNDEIASAYSDTEASSASSNPALKEIFTKAFGTLSEEDRIVLHLATKEVAHAEIGEMLDKSADAVKVHYHRARKRLREKLESLAKDMSVDITGADWGGLKSLKGQKEAGI